VVSLISQLLYFPGKEPQEHSEYGWEVPVSYETMMKRKISYLCKELNKSPHCPANSLVTIQITLPVMWSRIQFQDPAALCLQYLHTKTWLSSPETFHNGNCMYINWCGEPICQKWTVNRRKWRSIIGKITIQNRIIYFTYPSILLKCVTEYKLFHTCSNITILLKSITK